jgi:hypothetical protein
MEPTTLSMIPPGGTGTSNPKEPYVDHLTGNVNYPQPFSKPPLVEREGKRCDFAALQDDKIEYYAATGDKTFGLWAL